MKKFSSAIIFCLMVFAGFPQEQGKLIEKISTQLAAYYANIPSEKIFVETDKDVYSPGEVVWFSARVFDRTTQLYSTISADLTVKIFDNKGSMVASNLFRLENGKSFGDLKLPELLPRGRYYLAAYTPLQYSTDQIFTRLIYIDCAYNTDVVANFKNQEIIFDTSDEARFAVEIKSMEGKLLPKYRINYQLYLDTEIVESGKTKTEDNGEAIIKFKFPEETGTLPLRIVISDERWTWEKSAVIKTQKDVINVEIFAEGGNFVFGFPQKAAFKAKDIFGNYIKVNGDVLDKNGAIVAKGQSFAKGFGFFPLQCREGETYRFVVTSDYGKGQVFELPEATNIPTLSVLSVDQEFITTSIFCPAGKTQNIVLAATSGFNLLWAGEMAVAGPSRFKIPANGFPDGLVMISAFDQASTLLSRRLVHIDKNKNLLPTCNHTVSGNNLNLLVSSVDETANPANSEAIISVVSANYILGATPDLYAQIRLNPELANPVPGDIKFTNRAQVKSALDYILIANSLKSFSWENIINFNPSELSQISDNQLGLSGKVTGKYKLPVPEAKISVFDSRTMKVYSKIADSEGKFFFPSLNPVAANDFTITATDKKGRKDYEVVINKTFDGQLGDMIVEIDLTNTDVDVSREKSSEFLKLNSSLIAEPPKRPVFVPKAIEPPYKDLLKTSTSILEVIKSIKPYQLFNGQIVFSGMFNSLNNQSGAVIVVDGQNLGTSVSTLESFNPRDIDEINIFTDPINTQKYTSFASAGLIEIFTKNARPNTNNVITLESDQSIYDNGHKVPLDFSAYKKSLPEDGKKLNSTLFWDPKTILSKGVPASLSIPFSGLNSDYAVSAICFGEEGRVGTFQTIIKK